MSRQNKIFSNFNVLSRFLSVRSDHTFTCQMDSLDSVITFTYLTVTIDGNTLLSLNKEFLVVADPLVEPLSLENATVFQR